MKDVKINNIANLLVIPDRYCKSKYIKSAFNKTFSVIFTDMSSDFGFPRIRRKKQNQRNHSRQSKKETDKTANQSKLQTIDLFRLYKLFSHYRSCDDTEEIWSFVLFIKKSACRHIHACFNEQDKGSNLLGIITWSVLGKQNVQAKKVHYLCVKECSEPPKSKSC